MAQKRVTAKKSAQKRLGAKKSAPKRLGAKKSAPKRVAAKKTGKAKFKPVPKQKDQFAFGVTTIRSISNYCSSIVTLTNTESGDVVNVPPNDTVSNQRLDIPWADDFDTFKRNHLRMDVADTPRYYIFQPFGTVCYCWEFSDREWHYERVPGYSRSDGDRALIIKSDKNIEIQRA